MKDDPRKISHRATVAKMFIYSGLKDIRIVELGKIEVDREFEWIDVLAKKHCLACFVLLVLISTVSACGSASTAIHKC